MSSVTGYTKEKIDAMFAGIPLIWAANTVYPVGALVINPNGDIVKRVNAGTSGANYDADAANWALSATYASIGSVPPTTLDGGNATSTYTGTFNFDGGSAT